MPNASRSLKSKGYRTVTHVVPTDDDAVIAYLTAQEELTRARTRNQPAKAVAELEQKVADAETLVRETAIVVKMRALPQHEYAKLKAAHTPKEADHDEVRDAQDNPKAKARWHSDTFEPALVAACMVEPETLTVVEAAKYKTEWNESEWFGLFAAALRANEQATSTGGLLFK